MKPLVLIAAGAFGVVVPMAAQTIKNPRAIAFTCPDHAVDDAHEVDIIRVSDGAVVQTVQIGDPPMTESGEVYAEIHVQSLDFGAYVVVVRAKAGALMSDSSDPSDVWERAPGKPRSVRVER